MLIPKFWRQLQVRYCLLIQVISSANLNLAFIHTQTAKNANSLCCNVIKLCGVSKWLPILYMQP